MIRRLRDVLLVDLALVYGYHLTVLGVRYALSRRGLRLPEPCLEDVRLVLPPRRGECAY